MTSLTSKEISQRIGADLIGKYPIKFLRCNFHGLPFEQSVIVFKTFFDTMGLDKTIIDSSTRSICQILKDIYAEARTRFTMIIDDTPDLSRTRHVGRCRRAHLGQRLDRERR